MASPGAGARTMSPPDSTGPVTQPPRRTDPQLARLLKLAEQVLNQVETKKNTGKPPEPKNDGTQPTSPQLSKLTEEFRTALDAASQLRTFVKAEEPDKADPIRDDEGEMQIGLTRLIIPPEHVHVAEVPQHYEMPGLRTDTSTVIKSGKGRIQITLSVPFEGADMINGTLREIIAQFRSYPYVPVVSKYLTRIVQPKVQRPLPKEDAKAIATRREQATTQVSDVKVRFLDRLTALRSIHPKLDAELKQSDEFTKALIALTSVASLNEIDSAFHRVTSELRNATFRTTTPGNINIDVEKTVAVLNMLIDELRFAITNLERLRFQEIQVAVGGLMDPAEGIIPCCLDGLQVQTVPGRPGLLRAVISLVYFNPIPYGGILQYRDIFGQATVDPEQSVFMRAQIGKWMVNPSPPEFPSELQKRDTGDQEQRTFERNLNIIGLGQVTDDPGLDRSGLKIAYATADINAEDPSATRERLQSGQEGISEQIQAQIPRWRELDLGRDRAGVVVRYVSAGLANRLAPQPIPGEFYASMQYMGARPARITVQLAVTDQEVLSEIHLMKVANQRMSTLGIRHWRRPEVYIRNPIINMLGIWTAQIDTITTESETPNTTKVVINFIEHRVDPRAAIITRPQVLSRDRMEQALRFLFRHSQESLTAGIQRLLSQEIVDNAKTPDEAEQLLDDLNTVRLAQGQDPIFRDELFNAVNKLNPIRQKHQDHAADLLFGSETGNERGVITANVVRKAFFLDKAKNGAQRLIQKQIREIHQDLYFDSLEAATTARRGSAAALAGGRLLTDENAREALRRNEGAERASESAATNFARLIIQKYRGKVPNISDRYPDQRQRLRALGYSEGQINSLVPIDPGMVEVDNSIPIANFAPHAPKDIEIAALVEHLIRNSGNNTDELEFEAEGRDQVKVTSRTGEDKTEDVFIMLRLMRAILHNEVQPPGQAGLRDTVLGRGTTISDFLQQIGSRDYPSMLYRDLGLPKYRDALAPVLRAIQAHRRKKLADQGNAPDDITDESVRVVSVNELSKEERGIIALFIPTYRQLGVAPRSEERSLDDFAYDFDDDVLPDFPFFGRNRDAVIGQFKAEVDRHSQKADSRLKRKDLSAGKVPADPLNQKKVQSLFDEDRIGRTSDPVTKSGTEVASLAFENQDVLLTEAYAPARFRAQVQDFGVDTPENVRDIFDAATHLEADAHLTMQKCFPTFRVFFIEEDTQEGGWRAIDDVYGFNSVIELNITRHKYQPALAEIVFNNAEGTLEYDKFSNAHRDTNEGPVVSAVEEERGVRAGNVSISESAGPAERVTGERVLRKFPLREGTRIMVQLGYQSRSDYLVTVFTGKIAEVTQGDMVKIIAQDYTQELLFPVVENPSTESASGIIETMMDSPTVEHFGRWTPFSHERLSAPELANAKDTGFLSGLFNDLGGFFADPKLRNVFVAKYRNWWTKTRSKILEEDWEAGGGQKTAWDIIQEVINYSPGYIAAVVPFDLEATLFVGRPEQPYFWTDGLRQDEQKYLRTRARRELDRLQADVTSLLTGFRSSTFWHGGVRNDAELFRFERNLRGKELTDALLRLARSHPLWTLSLPLYQVRFGFDPRTGGAEGAGIAGAARRVDIENEIEELAKIPVPLQELLTTIGSEEVDYPDIARLLITSILGSDATQVLSDQNLRFFSRGRTGRNETGAQQAQRALKTVIDVGAAQGALMFVPDPIEFYSEIWDGERVTKSKIDRAIEKRKAGWGGTNTVSLNFDFLAKFLYSHRGFIPVFFRALLSFFKSDPLTAVARTIGSNTKKWPLNPRMKPFREYHLLSSFEDIMENQVACTRGAMWNGVAISKGSGTPLQLWADDGIVKGDRILRYFTEPNADLDIYNVTSLTTPPGDFVANQYLVGFSRLAQGLRPMYRGQLVCRGRPDIKPWDICYVYDAYNMIFGPVEVERVTHHFSAETGFTTTIVPHAIAIPNNHVDSLRIMQTGWLYGGIAAASVLLVGGIVTGGLLWVGAGALTAVGIGLGAAQAGQVIASTVLEEGTGAGILGNFMGVGTHGGLKMPVRLIPMMRMGTPWVAGLRGFGRDPNRGLNEVVNLVWERLGKKAQDIAAAKDFFFQQLGDTRRGLSSMTERFQQESNLRRQSGFDQ